MVNNCRVLQCFGALNQVAADSMAEMTGFASGNAMLDLGRNEMVLQLAGDEAVVAQLPNYLADPAFHNLYDRNPYHDPNRPVMPRDGVRQRMYARPGPPALSRRLIRCYANFWKSRVRPRSLHGQRRAVWVVRIASMSTTLDPVPQT